MEEYPEAIEEKIHKNVTIAFPKGIQELIKEAMKKKDQSHDMKILAEAAKIVRKEVYKKNYPKFDGTFDEDCQESFLPSILKVFITMLLHGIDIQEDMEFSQPILTIGQLLIFNMKKKKCQVQKDAKTVSRIVPPLCNYLLLESHSQNRNKVHIQKMNKLGLCPSYDFVLSIEDQLVGAVCEQYNQNGVVTPRSLEKNRFCIGAIDNIDHNPSSTTAKSSFHGTSISMIQVGESCDEKMEPIHIPPKSNRRELPKSYRDVPVLELQTNKMKVPPRPKTFNFEHLEIEEEEARELSWLTKSSAMLSNELGDDEQISWSGFHASKQKGKFSPICSQGIYPVFYNTAATLSMIRHGMDVIKKSVSFLNPGQIPVMVGDQPLYALGKKIQWLLPKEFGEDKFVMWPGGLHIEMTMLKVIGSILECTGWDGIISEAEVVTSGVAKSLLKVAHLTRTRNAHQVFTLALFALKRKAWSISQETSGQRLTYHEWCKQSSQKFPTFFLWGFIR